jgi:hypothetical protein
LGERYREQGQKWAFAIKRPVLLKKVKSQKWIKTVNTNKDDEGETVKP